MNSSTCLCSEVFSSMNLLMAAVRSGALLNSSLMPLRVSSILSMASSTLAAVIASMRRIPAAIELSLTIFIMPMLPVLATCVPPHSSTESPYLMTRTLSPYFSPKRAIAPISRAWAMGTSRCSSRAMVCRTRALARCSTWRISSSVIFLKCEKSKRSMWAST